MAGNGVDDPLRAPSQRDDLFGYRVVDTAKVGQRFVELVEGVQGQVRRQAGYRRMTGGAQIDLVCLGKQFPRLAGQVGGVTGPQPNDGDRHRQVTSPHRSAG